MRNFLICSAVLIIIASLGLLYHNQLASAVPVSYNVTSIATSIPFTTFTKNTSSTASNIFVEAGYNGTLTAIYEGHAENNRLYYKLGYHPTLPLSLDTFGNLTASASTKATQKLNVTVASGHNNVVLVVAITFDHTSDTNHNNARMSSVKIGTTPFILSTNETVTCGGAACDSEIWSLYNPPTGFNTITITPASVTNYHMVAGVYSLYNVRGLSPTSALAVNTATSTLPSIALTPTYAGSSMLIANLLSLQTTSPTTSTDTIEWVGKTSVLMGSSQFKASPAIGSGNTMTWSTTNVQWLTAAVEVVPAQDQTTFNFYLANVPRRAADTMNIFMAANGSNIYYNGATNAAGSGPLPFNHINILTGVETHDFSIQIQNTAGNVNEGAFITQSHIFGFHVTSAASSELLSCLTCGNVSLGTANSLTTLSNQLFKVVNNNDLWYNTNGTGLGVGTNTNACVLTYNVTTVVYTPIDSIACDYSIPNHINRFWNGFYLKSTNNYYTNSSLPFFITTNANTYKTELTIPASIYVTPSPDVKFFGHFNGQDYLMLYQGNTMSYTPLAYLHSLLHQNRAYQTFLLTLVNTDSNDNISPTSANPKVNIKYYGPSLNTTASLYGLVTLPSGYTARFDTNSEHDVRTLDPRWLNLPQQNYPAVFSTGSLFPIFLTVSNAPTDASLMITHQSQTINNLAGIWSLVTLDTSHTAEFDLPPNVCANIYVADNSLYPLVYSYQGNVCANGVNQKTVYYTNTLPTTFYTMHYGATSSYVPATNALTTTVRSTTAPFTYNVLIRNSTGTITTNSTFTINGTLDTQVFNVSSTAKPGALFISVPGTGTIYSSYLGSALSFASTMSFFHQYFSYQGFDLLSFIPIIFASMFTRNTVGIGMAMVTVLVATLSFLSVVVVSDATMGIMVVIMLIGLIGYRGLYG